MRSAQAHSWRCCPCHSFDVFCRWIPRDFTFDPVREGDYYYDWSRAGNQSAERPKRARLDGSVPVALTPIEDVDDETGTAFHSGASDASRAGTGSRKGRGTENASAMAAAGGRRARPASAAAQASGSSSRAAPHEQPSAGTSSVRSLASSSGLGQRSAGVAERVRATQPAPGPAAAGDAFTAGGARQEGLAEEVSVSQGGHDVQASASVARAEPGAAPGRDVPRVQGQQEQQQRRDAGGNVIATSLNSAAVAAPAAASEGAHSLHSSYDSPPRAAPGASAAYRASSSPAFVSSVGTSHGDILTALDRWSEQRRRRSTGEPAADGSVQAAVVADGGSSGGTALAGSKRQRSSFESPPRAAPGSSAAYRASSSPAFAASVGTPHGDILAALDRWSEQRRRRSTGEPFVDEPLQAAVFAGESAVSDSAGTARAAASSVAVSAAAAAPTPSADFVAVASAAPPPVNLPVADPHAMVEAADNEDDGDSASAGRHAGQATSVSEDLPLLGVAAAAAAPAPEVQPQSTTGSGEGRASGASTAEVSTPNAANRHLFELMRPAAAPPPPQPAISVAAAAPLSGAAAAVAGLGAEAALGALPPAPMVPPTALSPPALSTLPFLRDVVFRRASRPGGGGGAASSAAAAALPTVPLSSSAFGVVAAAEAHFPGLTPFMPRARRTGRTSSSLPVEGGAAADEAPGATWQDDEAALATAVEPTQPPRAVSPVAASASAAAPFGLPALPSDGRRGGVSPGLEEPAASGWPTSLGSLVMGDGGSIGDAPVPLPQGAMPEAAAAASRGHTFPASAAAPAPSLPPRTPLHAAPPPFLAASTPLPSPGLAASAFGGQAFGTSGLYGGPAGLFGGGSFYGAAAAAGGGGTTPVPQVSSLFGLTRATPAPPHPATTPGGGGDTHAFDAALRASALGQHPPGAPLSFAHPPAHLPTAAPAPHALLAQSLLSHSAGGGSVAYLRRKSGMGLAAPALSASAAAATAAAGGPTHGPRRASLLSGGLGTPSAAARRSSGVGSAAAAAGGAAAAFAPAAHSLAASAATFGGSGDAAMGAAVDLSALRRAALGGSFARPPTGSSGRPMDASLADTLAALEPPPAVVPPSWRSLGSVLGSSLPPAPAAGSVEDSRIAADMFRGPAAVAADILRTLTEMSEPMRPPPHAQAVSAPSVAEAGVKRSRVDRSTKKAEAPSAASASASQWGGFEAPAAPLAAAGSQQQAVPFPPVPFAAESFPASSAAQPAGAFSFAAAAPAALPAAAPVTAAAPPAAFNVMFGMFAGAAPAAAPPPAAAAAAPAPAPHLLPPASFGVPQATVAASASGNAPAQVARPPQYSTPALSVSQAANAAPLAAVPVPVWEAADWYSSAAGPKEGGGPLPASGDCSSGAGIKEALAAFAAAGPSAAAALPRVPTPPRFTLGDE